MSDLTSKERDFWLKGGAHYREAASEEAVYVVPKEDGILGHEAAAEIIEAEGIWDEVEMEEVREQEMGDVTVLTYRAEGRRGEAVYRALCSTVYRDGTLVHHQQTPLAPHETAGG